MFAQENDVHIDVFAFTINVTITHLVMGLCSQTVVLWRPDFVVSLRVWLTTAVGILMKLSPFIFLKLNIVKQNHEYLVEL